VSEVTSKTRLVVTGKKTRYVIEPHRFELGLSRVEMVDRHLKYLAEPRSEHPDVDKLLDARLRYMAQEGPTSEPMGAAA
jgi:hypothetical protein